MASGHASAGLRAGGAEQVPPRRIAALLWAPVALAASTALGPLLADFCRRLWAAEHYRYALPLVGFALVWGVWRYVKATDAAFGVPRALPRVFGWGVTLVAAAVAVTLYSPFAAVLATLSLIQAGLYERGGGRLVSYMLPVWCVLWLAVPLPFNWDQELIRLLQRSATGWASGVLDLAHVRHLADGVVIRIPGQDFFVDQACSGVHSLFSALAFTGVFVAMTGRGLLSAACVAVSAVWWVLVGNVARICAVVVLAGQYDLPVTAGLGHEILGLIIFAIVIGLVCSTDRLARFFLAERPGLFRRLIQVLRHKMGRASSGDIGSSEELNRSPVAAWRTAMTTVALTAGFAGLAAAGFAHPHRRAFVDLAKPLEEFKPVQRETLPVEWSGWRQTGFEVRRRATLDPAGMLSRIWTYEKGRLTAAVSVDGPYAEWHDLAACYRGMGYTVVSAHDTKAAEPGSPDAGFTELSLQNDRGRQGMSLFMSYTESDRPIAPRAGGAFSLRLGAGLQGWSGRSVSAPGEAVYNVQMFTETGLLLTEAEKSDLRGLFHEMRRTIARTPESRPLGSRKGRPVPTPRGEAAAGRES